MKRPLATLLAQYLALFAVAVTANFFVVYLVPGDIVDMISRGLSEVGSDALAEEARVMLKEYFGLDQPVLIQFVNYLSGLLRGDLGTSFYYRQPVGGIVIEFAVRTLVLITLGIGLALIAGIPLGVISASGRGKRIDSVMMLTQIAIHSVPPFLIAMALLIVFAVVFKVLPFSGSATAGSGFALPEAKFLILPVASLFLWEITTVYYFTRNVMIDALREDHIFVARAKGLDERTIIFRHALRAAAPALVARFALLFGTSVGGVFFVENVFSYPGIATLALTAFENYDYTLLRGIFLLLTTAILAVNFFADLCLHKLDPRSRAV